MKTTNDENIGQSNEQHIKGTQICPQCGNLMGNMPGSKDAICKNCGFKDPCCE